MILFHDRLKSLSFIVLKETKNLTIKTFSIVFRKKAKLVKYLLLLINIFTNY